MRRRWESGRGGARRGGFTLVELLLAVAIASVLLLALNGVVGPSLEAWSVTHERNELTEEARFAMERMVRSVQRTRLLLLPLAENPATPHSESVRDVLAVSLDPEIDRDGDGFADADNDRDGRVDEDFKADLTDEGLAGLPGIDDDGDGVVDEGGLSDDDEDGAIEEDPIDGIDNDGDGAVDEDPGSDNNDDLQPGVGGVDDDGDGFIDEGPPPNNDEDGNVGDDRIDAVAYRLTGSTLVERLPDPNGASGADFTERPVAENVTQLQITRVPSGPGDRAVQVEIVLDLAVASGETVSLQTRVRVGSGL